MNRADHIIIMRISKQSQNRIICHYVKTVMLISPLSLSLSPQLHHPADSTGECQVRSECVFTSMCVYMHVFDVMFLKCNPHQGQHCIHHCLSGSLTACVCALLCVSWMLVDLLICVCLCHWCQTLFRQCFHNACICVCHACKTVLISITAVCLGFCVSAFSLLLVGACGLVCTVLLFSHASSYPSSVYIWVIECRQPSQRAALWLGSGCVSWCLSLLLSYCHCWPCCLYRSAIKVWCGVCVVLICASCQLCWTVL